MKRIGIFSDFHCGHKVGLTPPDYWSGGKKIINRLSERWEWFAKSLKDNGPFDAAIIMGDTVDGPGVKNGQETILNMNQQVTAAAEIISKINTEKIFMVYGTPVHTTAGGGYELEKGVADILGVEIHGQIWINADGYILDCRHHPAGNSQVYPGNPLVKERESNLRWNREGGVQPEAQFIIRGHTHRMYTVCEPNRWMGIACPALQDYGTVYGRRLSNTVHMGWGTLDISKGKWPRWTVYEAPKKKKIVLSL